MGKKVLVIGQGGREHALVWKIAQSPQVEKVYAAPGNPGIAELAECIDIHVQDVDKLLEFALDANIDLTVVGPEAPLIKGIVDRFQDKGLKIFGPSAQAAQLEGSKVFTKNLLKKYQIPTAKFQVFDQAEPARQYARSLFDQGESVVIKADGLAAGKGVVVAKSWEEARAAIDSMMLERSFGQAGELVVVEECLQGEEVSLFVLSDGKDFISLVSAQDHKRVFDYDEGPNTGGMGAYLHPPVYEDQIHEQVEEQIIKPVIKAMATEGCPYKGVLYAGLMITKDGPRVLEFNARFGDPETQAIMPAIAVDIVPLFEAVCEGKLKDLAVRLEEQAFICVILSSQGYPGDYEKGKVITGLDQLAADTLVFHNGTRFENGSLLTNGGRVLSVVCQGQNMEDAIKNVYRETAKIHFAGMHYRKDIGSKAIRREE